MLDLLLVRRMCTQEKYISVQNSVCSFIYIVEHVNISPCKHGEPFPTHF